MRRALALLAAASAAAMLLPSSSGAVTVGAPLNLPANVAEGCQGFVIFGTPPSCTVFGLDSRGAWSSQTPRGSWTITTARVRTGLSVGPMAFTVVRSLRSQAGSPASGAICCSVPAESPVFVPAPNTVNEIPVSLPVTNTVEDIEGEPVEVVDYLGVSMLDLSSSLPLHRATSAADPAVSAGLSYFIPAMRRGQQALQAGGATELVPLVNGDYQPAPARGPACCAPSRRSRDAPGRAPPAPRSGTAGAAAGARARRGAGATGRACWPRRGAGSSRQAGPTSPSS